MHNREQDIPHSLCLCGFLPSDRAQRCAARNKRSGIPLNGVSRVRIPPPPLSTPAWQHGDSRLSARFWPGCPCLSPPAAVEFDAHGEARVRLAEVLTSCPAGGVLKC